MNSNQGSQGKKPAAASDASSRKDKLSGGAGSTQRGAGNEQSERQGGNQQQGRAGQGAKQSKIQGGNKQQTGAGQGARQSTGPSGAGNLQSGDSGRDSVLSDSPDRDERSPAGKRLSGARDMDDDTGLSNTANRQSADDASASRQSGRSNTGRSTIDDDE